MNDTINSMQVVVFCFNICLIFYAIISNIKGKIRCHDQMIVIYIAFVSIFLCFIILKNNYFHKITLDPERLYLNLTFIISIVHFYIIYSFVKKRERRKDSRNE